MEFPWTIFFILIMLLCLKLPYYCWFVPASIAYWCYREWLLARKFKGLPGPSWSSRLPLIGHAYQLGQDPCKYINMVTKVYGSVFRFDIGSHPTVVITSYDLMVEAFKKEVFNGRMYNEIGTMNAIMPTNPETGKMRHWL